MTAVKQTVRLVRAANTAWSHKWLFLGAFLAILFLSFSALMWFGLVPDSPSDSALDAEAATVADTPLVTLSSVPLSPDVSGAFAAGELPVKVAIPAINLSVSVADPSTTNVDTLDQYLLKGAVRYPTSGLLGENGNVILFGHSSYLPIVNNPAYKTFDGIQKLKAGDGITVYSSDRAYTYSVDRVNEENANSAAIPLTVGGQELTLSTCDSFATKSDRFVVTAHFVSSRSL